MHLWLVHTTELISNHGQHANSSDLQKPAIINKVLSFEGI